MKIAILGVPGAGKTEFARELAKQLVESKLLEAAVRIDEYVDSLRKITGLEYGHFGSHIDDMQVVFKRREWELEMEAASHTTITCGTVLDSAAHFFVRTEESARNPREIALQSERLRSISESFGFLYTDTWDYDYAFYLPYKGDDSTNRLMDKVLNELLSAYAPFVLSFKTEVPDDEKASIAARAIATFEEKQLPEAPERGVRSGSEDRGEDGDSPESVPDVPEQGRASDDA